MLVLAASWFTEICGIRRMSLVHTRLSKSGNYPDWFIFKILIKKILKFIEAVVHLSEKMFQFRREKVPGGGFNQ